QRLLPEYPDGAWFVDLAPLTQGERVVETLAVALSVREEPGRAVTQTLVDHLASRKALIVLDHCEQLIPACVEIGRELLNACADLKLLATSREPLGVSGERVHPVPTLALPAPSTGASAGALAKVEAVRLFVERARGVSPEFALTDGNAPTVAQ